MSKMIQTCFFFCPFCGQPMIRDVRPGRPRVQHENCGNVSRMLAWSAEMLTHIDMTPERAAVVRSDLLHMANALPVARSANGRFQSKKRREGES